MTILAVVKGLIKFKARASRDKSKAFHGVDRTAVRFFYFRNHTVWFGAVYSGGGIVRCGAVRCGFFSVRRCAVSVNKLFLITDAYFPVAVIPRNW